jgi:hypothetical protein
MLPATFRDAPDNAIIIVLVTGSPCDTSSPIMEQQLREKCEQHPAPIVFHTMCVPEDKMPWPRIMTSVAYYFFPNSTKPICWRTNPVYTFDADITLLQSMQATGASYNEAFYGDLHDTVEQIDAMFVEERKHNYPPFFTQIRGFARDMWETGKRASRNLPVVVPADEGYRRISLCNGCDKNDNGRCSACGCSINTKSQLAASSCPLGKWDVYK